MRNKNAALLLSRKNLESILKMKDVIEAVKEAYRERGLNSVLMPSRIRIDVERYNGNILIMPAYLKSMDALGTKLVTTHLENFKFNLPTVMGVIVLNDPKTGIPLSIMDGTYITALRTGAAGAVAAEYLSRKDSSIVTIIGAGVQGCSQLIGLCEVRKIKKVFIFDVDQKKCEEYVKVMREHVDAEIIKGSSIKDAVQESDIVVTATSSSTPVIKGEWLTEGCHVNGIGSHSPDARELDENVIKKASKIVLDTWDAKNVGDIAYPISKGMFKEENIYGEIGEIVAGKKPGRITEKEITVFKSVGTAITDVATALKAYKLAKEKGVGHYISILD